MDQFLMNDKSRAKKFNLHTMSKHVASFDRAEEVLDYVRHHLDQGYMIYLGEGVALDSEETEEIRRKWRTYPPFPR